MTDDLNIQLTNLYPIRSVYTIIGCLMNSPQAVRNPEMPLSEKDFYQSFHKNIFTAINNIAYSDSKLDHVSPIDIDNYLAQYPANYKIWEQHNGLEYVTSAMENANKNTYKQNYWRIKKFAMLRDYVANGIDVKSLYDYSLEDLKLQADQMKALDKLNIDDMVDHFSVRLLELRDKWSIGERRIRFKAGDGLDTLLDRLALEPEMGYPFRNGFYNSVFRGMREKKFMLRSAGTGVGKTRLSIADIANCAVDMIWDYGQKKYVSNGPSQPVLFISTELEKDELQTGILAFVSGIDEDVIKNGKYSNEVRERLMEAIKIIQRAPFFAEYIDDFSVADIETVIEQHIIDNNVKFIAFDYIQLVPKLARTMQESFAGGLREDQILVQLSSALKLLSNKYNVYIVSATQLNRNAKEHEMRDTSSLRGGSATADKVDHGIMVFRTTAKDLEGLKHILENNFAMKPNFCHYVYKNRGGSKVGVILWTRYHGGTIREEELFVTDLDYNLIDVENLHVEFDEVPVTDSKHNKFVVEHNEELDEVPAF